MRRGAGQSRRSGPGAIDAGPVKSGVGLSLARDSIAIAEAQAHGLTIVDGVTVPAALTFVTLAERSDEPAIAAALRLIEQQ
jgi:hypothetical protein